MKGSFVISTSVYLSILPFFTVHGILIRNSLGNSSRPYSKTNWKSTLPSQVSSEPYTYQNPASYSSSYYPSHYNLSRQDDNNNGFGFDNGGNGGFGIGGATGGGGFGATGGGLGNLGVGGGGGEALGVGGGIIAAIGLAILAIFVIPLILLLLLGLLILPFSPLLLLLLLLLIPETQKKIIFGEPPGNGIFPRSFNTSSYFISNFESIFKMILQAIESQDIPCSDDISCQNATKNEIGVRRENPAVNSTIVTPTKELPEWKKVLRSALQHTQAFTLQVAKRLNNMKSNVSKIGSSAAASAISKISKVVP